jgi:seryl-tRNA synthetase
MKLRYKDSEKRNRFVHILNGSGVALPRLMIAILENYQEADGRVRIPEAIRKYFPGRQYFGEK